MLEVLSAGNSVGRITSTNLALLLDVEVFVFLPLIHPDNVESAIPLALHHLVIDKPLAL